MSPTLLLALLLLQDPGAGITAVAELPGGRLAVAGPAGIRIGDAAPAERWSVTSLALSPDGSRLAAGGGRAGRSGEVRVYELATGRTTWSLSEHADLVTSLAWSPDGKELYAGGHDRTVTRYSAGGKLLATWLGHTGAVLALSVAKDGTVATAGLDGTIRTWDPATGATRRTLASHVGAVQALAWAPDGTRLASGGKDGTVRVFEPAIGRLVRIVRGHGGAEPTALAWARDGATLASGASDGRVRVIEAGGDRILAVHGGGDDRITSLAAGAEGWTAGTWAGKLLRIR